MPALGLAAPGSASVRWPVRWAVRWAVPTSPGAPTRRERGAPLPRPVPDCLGAEGVGRYHQGVHALAQAGWRRSAAMSPLAQDAVLYLLSALFCAITAVVALSYDYREWGLMAGIAYGAGAAVTLAGWWRWRRGLLAATTVGWLRRGVVGLLLVGAVLVPLGLELSWRAQGTPGEHAQPEVAVIERAGDRAAAGQDPYLTRPTEVGVPPTSDRRSVDATAFFPYLPGMVPFGMLNAAPLPAVLRDARVTLAGFTLLVGAGTLLATGASGNRKGRALQFLVVLPTGALPLVTGGDDLPVLALLLVALVLAQRRRPVAAGLAMGLAASLKFTAWPLLVLLALAVRDREERASPWRYLAAVATVAVPVVAAGFLASPRAFVQNVIRFPLGLTKVHSPAASPLLGQVLVHAFFHHKLLVTGLLLVVGAGVVLVTLLKHPPRTPAAAARFAAFTMALATLLAPATRFGYLIYPANLVVWGYLLDGVPLRRTQRRDRRTAADQSASLRSRTSKDTVLVGALCEPPDRAGVIEGVAGSMRTPTSQ